jgi:hypothetical protein
MTTGDWAGLGLGLGLVVLAAGLGDATGLGDGLGLGEATGLGLAAGVAAGLGLVGRHCCALEAPADASAALMASALPLA